MNFAFSGNLQVIFMRSMAQRVTSATFLTTKPWK